MTEINDNVVNTEGGKIIDECKYHLCTKKNIEVQICPYCNKHYCVDHINPKIPMQPNFDDSKQIGEWKEGENYYHPCPDYYDYVQKQEKNKERSISHSIDTMPRGKVSYRIFKKSPDYGHIRDETPKSIRKEQQTSDNTKHIDKPYFVPSDNRSMSYDKSLPQTERTTRNEKPRPSYLFNLKNTIRNVQWTKKRILLVFILATVITNIIGMILLKGEIFGFPKSNCALISLCGIFVTVLGIISSVQSNRAYMNWDRSEARHVRQWTKGVQREEEYHNFNMSMTGILMAIGMSMMILPIIVLFETIVGTVLFILNLIYAVGILILIRKVFRRR
jgi:hypothetical protein